MPSRDPGRRKQCTGTAGPTQDRVCRPYEHRSNKVYYPNNWASLWLRRQQMRVQRTRTSHEDDISLQKLEEFDEEREEHGDGVEDDTSGVAGVTLRQWRGDW